MTDFIYFKHCLVHVWYYGGSVKITVSHRNFANATDFD